MLKKYLFVSGIIFGSIAILHLIRAIMNWQFIIGSWSVPVWISWLALIGTGIMCVAALIFYKNYR